MCILHLTAVKNIGLICEADMSLEVFGDSSVIWHNITYDLWFIYIYFIDSAF